MKKVLLALVLVSTPILLADQTPGGVLASPGQRFVFGQVSAMSRDQYLLDTATGRLWQVVVSKDGGTKLSPVPYRLVGGGYTLNAPTQEQEGASPKPAPPRR